MRYFALCVVVGFIGLAFTPTSAKFATDNDTSTGGGGTRFSGYKLSFADADFAGKVTQAIRLKKDVSIYAVSLELPSSLDVSGVPNFRVYAHSCTALAADAKLTITNTGERGSRGSLEKPSKQVNGKDGTKGENGGDGTDGGNVLLYCSNWTKNTSVVVDTKGGNGGGGGVGGDGGDGVNGTAHRNGSCKKKGFKCRRSEGVRGRAAGSGGRGGEGGDGGDGGKGGSVAVLKSELLSSTELTVSGGYGLTGGRPGNPGKKGTSFDPFLKVTKCKCRGTACSRCEVRVTELRHRLVHDGPSGYRGARGRNGGSGSSARPTQPAALPKEMVVQEDIQFWLRLLQRYVSDRLLSVEGTDSNSPKSQEVAASGLKVLETIRSGADLLPTDLAVGRKDFSSMLQARLKTGSGYFGRSVLQREVPEFIDNALLRKKEYASEVAGFVDRAKLADDLKSIVLEAAAISVPNTDFGKLQNNLRNKRKQMVLAVGHIQVELDAALSSAQFRLANAEQEAVRKEIQAQTDRILSLTSAGIGLGGSIAGRDPFATFDSAVQIGQEVANIVESAEGSGCSIDGLKELLQRGGDLDLRAGFPSESDFNQDLSKLNRVDLIGIVRKAEIESNAAELTSQLSCVFSTDEWETLPSVRAAFDRIFINAAARADLVDSIVNIDAELAALEIERQGVEQQKAELIALSEGSQGRAAAIDALSAKYESARDFVLQGLASLSAAYKLVSLVEFNDIIADFGKFRLEANGVIDVAVEHTELLSTHLKLSQAFEDRARCFGASPDKRFFFWDVPVNSSVQPLQSGPDSQFAFQLSWHSDCGMYGRTKIPVRDLPNAVLEPCQPNRVVFNSRTVQMGIELIGGDKSVLPSNRAAVSTFVDQIGRQTFRSSANGVTVLNIASQLTSLKDTPLADGEKLALQSVCSTTGNAESLVTAPVSCPSPFSTYLLKLNEAADADLDKYLGTVTHVRVHMEVSSSQSRCIENNLARVKAMLNRKAQK